MIEDVWEERKKCVAEMRAVDFGKRISKGGLRFTFIGWTEEVGGSVGGKCRLVVVSSFYAPAILSVYSLHVLYSSMVIDLPATCYAPISCLVLPEVPK